MTPHRLLITRRAQKDIAQLANPLKLRIAAALDRIAEDPFLGKALKGEMHGSFSYRVGMHRIIYEIHKLEILVIVLKVGHRREIYRRQ